MAPDIQSSISILIANAAPATALGLSQLLKAPALKILPTVNTIQGIINALNETSANLLLLDTQLFKQQKLQDYFDTGLLESNQTQILLHGTTAEQLPELQELLAKQVRGFIPLSANAQEFHHAIHHIAAGGLLFTGNMFWQQTQSEQNKVYMQRIKSLWQQEQRVLKLLATGWKKEKIALRLKISLKTVQKYQTHILKKLQAKSAFELLNRDFLDALEQIPDEYVNNLHNETEDQNKSEI